MCQYLIWYNSTWFTSASALVIYVSKLPLGACSIRACSISNHVLTPQQQCLLQFFLRLPVDQVTSKIPSLRERCCYTLDNGLLLKAKRPIRDLTTGRESRSYMGPSDILDLNRCRWVSFNMPPRHLGIMCIDFDWGIRWIAVEGVTWNSTIIQCDHEQSLTGICIFPVFYLLPMDHLCTNR